MSEWQTRTVEELCERITSGGTPRRSAPRYYHGGTIPWIKTGELHDAYVTEYEERITEEGLDNSSAKLLPQDTILMAMYGATVGALGMLAEPATCNQASCALIANTQECHPRWLFYRLLDDRDRIVSYATGAAQQNLSGALIRNLRYRVPSLEEQGAIAEVLGALDDKIEANRKLAATADELARSIFAEAAQDASLSEATYGDLAKIGGGGTPKSKVEEFWSGDVRWLTPTDVTALPGPYVEDTSRRISEAGLASISSPLYPVGSIAMTSRATIGSFAILDRPMAVNQGFIVVQPQDESLRLWIFHEMRRRVREFYDYANGATFMELSRGNFKKIRVHLSDYNTMSSFGERVRPLHDSARLALRQNETLVALRDTLLPKLMSGQLRVEAAEEMVVL